MNNTFIYRDLGDCLQEAFKYMPVITLTGPRQSGKTTLCRNLFTTLPYTNLEDASTLAEITTDPKAFLQKYPEGVIIDEAQNYPQIFSYLQVLVDEDRLQGNDKRHFIVTGSNNFLLLEKVSQSMAGRTAILTLLPLSISEIRRHQPEVSTDRLILNGGYPNIWKLGDESRNIMLSSYYSTYVERDLRHLLNVKDLNAFQTFIRLCAGRISSEYNASALSSEVGVSVNTINSWTSVLQASYVLYLLQPYYANIGKRLTKTPKVYFRDTGLATYLLGINQIEQLENHPLRGNLFENMVINGMLANEMNQGKNPKFYFYRDKGQHEVDLLKLNDDNSMEAYEIKSAMTYHTDFFKNLRYLKNLFPSQLTKTTLVYDGEGENQQAFDGYCNYRTLF